MYRQGDDFFVFNEGSSIQIIASLQRKWCILSAPAWGNRTLGVKRSIRSLNESPLGSANGHKDLHVGSSGLEWPTATALFDASVAP